MPCFHPMTAYRSRYLSASGKRPLVFKAEDALPGSELKIPCGGCVGCRVDKSSMWATRLMHESKWHAQKCFLTLTYDDLYLPDGGTLEPKVHEKFFKKFRKRLDDDFLRALGPRPKDQQVAALKLFRKANPLRYFWAGEYGDSTFRPHYHAIVFGWDFTGDRRFHSVNSRGENLYKSDTLNNLWGFGHCTIGEVTQESCGYVARYAMKKITGDRAKDHYARIHPETGQPYQLEPEFCKMSLKPGIGKRHYDKFKDDFYPSDHVTIRGRKAPVPRYYDSLLATENPELLESVKLERVARAKERRHDNTPNRLASRKAVLLSKLNQLPRDLK